VHRAGFPPFVMLLGVPRTTALTPQFFAACLLAGALSGVVNYVISRRVVGARLRILAERMTHVEQSLGSMTSSGDLAACTPEECAIVVDSEDEIGESALAFNRLVEALSASMRTQLAVRSFSEMLTSQLEIESLAEEALRQFFEHAGAAGGLILYDSAGELKVAAARGLRDPAAVAESGHVDAAVRLTAPLGVLMLDIDHFKAVNDTYGHLVGDRVLKSVSAIVRSSLREGDVLLRYGGEELLAVPPAASTGDVRQMAERLRQAVEDSAGGAAYPNQNVEHEDGLIRLADEALCRAKGGGRNRVEIAK